MTRLRRLRVPSILLLALVAALAFAATAAAETRVGEVTSPGVAGVEPEANILKANVTYESTAGSAVFNITTAAEPQAEVGGVPSSYAMLAGLFDAAGECDYALLENDQIIPPGLEITAPYKSATAEATIVTKNSSILGTATKSVSGDTTTLSFTSGAIANHEMNCAVVATGSGSEPNFLFFKVAAPPAPVVTTPTVTTPTPTPTAALSFAKPKSLNLKAGKWQKENVKISNTGAVAAGPISIKLKAPKGVVLQPASGSLKLPALLAGQSWTVTFQVKVTAKAKKSSTVSVSGAGPGISATSSFTIKLLG